VRVGSYFRSLSARKGESVFDVYCKTEGISHIFSGIGKPTTLGKIERWFRTYDLEHTRFPLHREFIQYYNYERPHISLSHNTPEVHFRDVTNVLGQYRASNRTYD